MRLFFIAKKGGNIMSKISQKQMIFAQKYVKTGNIYQAAIDAGYSESYARGNATKLLQNESICEYIESLNVSIEEKTIDIAAEIRYLLYNTLLAYKDNKDRLNTELEGCRFTVKELNKILGSYAPTKKAIEVEAQVVIDSDKQIREKLSTLSAEDLIKLVEDDVDE